MSFTMAAAWAISGPSSRRIRRTVRQSRSDRAGFRPQAQGTGDPVGAGSATGRGSWPPAGAAGPGPVVMIPRAPPSGGPDYCSRVCCTNTIKNALRLKMLNPTCQVVVLYKNIITYGFREQYHLEARRRGVLFVRYSDEEPPQVRLTPGDTAATLSVSVREHVFGETLTFEPDLVALSMPIEPSPGTEALARLFHL